VPLSDRTPSARQKLNDSEASIMGEFITSGIALAFGVGATVAVIARGHPLTRRHPNLIGLAAGATADAMTRDYRRPRVYDRLLQLDSPIARKARSVVMTMRTGEPEVPSDTSVQSPTPSTTLPPIPEPVPEQPFQWWASEQPQEEEPQPMPSYGMAPPIKLPMGGPIGGTRTWDEIRKSKSSQE
jgi:hypothetical protein